MNDWTQKLWDFLLVVFDSALRFIITLVIGTIIIKILMVITKKLLERNKKLDNTIKSFIVSVTRLLANVVFGIILLTTLNVPIASLIAILSSAGLAVSLAMQDSLGNFASGVLLLINKPFKENDYIEVNGFGGIIQKINILTTQIFTADNKTIIIPNNIISKSEITNYSTQTMRRIDLELSVDYKSDIEKVKSIVLGVINQHKKTLLTPQPLIRLKTFAESALVITARAWTNNTDYWEVYFDLNEQILQAFRENEIVIPYRKLDVSIINENSALEN